MWTGSRLSDSRWLMSAVGTMVAVDFKNVTYRGCTYRAWPDRGPTGHRSAKSEIAMLTDPRVLFGQRLAQVRKAKNWSQERLALESGIARSYLGGVERGQRNIALLNICRLADTLGLSAASLMELPNK